MASSTAPEDQRLIHGTTWNVLQQTTWWRTGNPDASDWVERTSMRLAHKFHVLGWLEDRATTILQEHARHLTIEARTSLFEDDLQSEADYFFELSDQYSTAALAVRSTPLYKRLVFDIVDRVGTGEAKRI